MKSVIPYLLILYTFALADIINVPEDSENIQSAIQAANDGDTVLVQEGTYFEKIRFFNKDLVVGSLFLTTGDESYISSTIIDGSTNANVNGIVTFEDGESLDNELIGFTITNGGSSDAEAGGIWLVNASSPSLKNLIISNNIANLGGGICIDYGSDPALNDILIINNYGFDGGGIYCGNSSNPTLTNVTIAHNSSNKGGGIQCHASSNATLTNVTIYGNTANNGGGIYSSGSNTIVSNSILWDNVPEEIYFSGGGSTNSIAISYSDINGGQEDIHTNNNATINWLDGNINSNPLFCNQYDNDFALAQNSPCLGTGENSVDIGAYGFGCDQPYVHNGPVWHVSTTGSDSTGDGQYGNPYATIQTGIDNADHGDTVLVAPGTYIEDIEINKFITVRGEDRQTTIIDANQNNNVVNFTVAGDTTVTLSGFTITNGRNDNGGGIYVETPSVSNVILNDLIISGNFADGSSPNGGNGGGIYCKYSNITITDVTIIDNIANDHGGAIYFETTDAIVTNTLITNNSADASTVRSYNSDLIFTDVIISNNEIDNTSFTFSNQNTQNYIFTNVSITNNTGGGINLYNSSNQTFTNMLIADNAGIGVSIYSSSSNSFTNMTITNNDSFGVIIYDNVSAGFWNSIIWGNSSDDIWTEPWGTANVNYSNVLGGWPGTGNIDANPIFCAPDSGDYNIAQNSPCVGTGENGNDMGAFGVGCEEINLAPVLATIEDQQIAEDNILTIGVSATSYLGYSMSFTATSNTSDVEVSLEDNNLTATPSLNWFGSSVITVIATDENELFDTTGFTLTVNAVNDAPVANNDTIMVDHNTDYVGQISWSDVDGDMEFSCNLLNNPSNGTANVSVEGSFVYSPTTDYSGNDSFTFTVCDNSLCDTATVQITIHALSIDETSLPTEYAIHQNYPNPFNPITTLRYDLPENSLVNIIIYDMLGREVKTLINQTQDAGYKSVVWNATNDYGKPVSAGIYLYQIQAGEYISTKKMVLLK